MESSSTDALPGTRTTHYFHCVLEDGISNMATKFVEKALQAPWQD